MRDPLQGPDRVANLPVGRAGALLELLTRNLEDKGNRDLEYDPLGSLIRAPVGEKGAADRAD